MAIHRGERDPSSNFDGVNLSSLPVGFALDSERHPILSFNRTIYPPTLELFDIPKFISVIESFCGTFRPNHPQNLSLRFCVANGRLACSEGARCK